MLEESYETQIIDYMKILQFDYQAKDYMSKKNNFSTIKRKILIEWVFYHYITFS